MDYFKSIVEEGEKGLRLDAYLIMQDDIEESRSYISTLISNGHVFVEGSVVTKPAYKVKFNQTIQLEIPDAVPVGCLPVVCVCK